VPLVAILLGAMMITLAVRGTEHTFAKQLGQDFGQSEFWSWAGALILLGSVGYVKALKPVQTPALALVIAVIVLRNGGVFTQLQQLITNPPQPAQPVSLTSYAQVGSSSSGGSSGGGGGLGGLLGSSGGGGLGDLFGGGGDGLDSLFGGAGDIGAVADVAAVAA
jgi:uncharacterized membrane protein YgcG